MLLRHTDAPFESSSPRPLHIVWTGSEAWVLYEDLPNSQLLVLRLDHDGNRHGPPQVLTDLDGPVGHVGTVLIAHRGRVYASHEAGLDAGLQFSLRPIGGDGVAGARGAPFARAAVSLAMHIVQLDHRSLAAWRRGDRLELAAFELADH
jgi:hypothetical protein